MRRGASMICCDNSLQEMKFTQHIHTRWSGRHTSGAVFCPGTGGQQDADPQTLPSVDDGDKWGLCWGCWGAIFFLSESVKRLTAPPCLRVIAGLSV